MRMIESSDRKPISTNIQRYCFVRLRKSSMADPQVVGGSLGGGHLPIHPTVSVALERGQATFRCENSHMMMASAIKPTRPFLPRSPTIAMMLATTPPKNGMFDPTSNAQTMARASSIRPTSVNAPTQFFTVCNASMCVSPVQSGQERDE